MKQLKAVLILIVISVIALSGTKSQALEERTVVYFKELSCLVCAELQGTINGSYDASLDYIKKLEVQGINVIVYDIQENDLVEDYFYENELGETVQVDALDVFVAFNDAYNREDGGVPVIFVGDTYFDGLETIREKVDDGTIYDLSLNNFREITVEEGKAYENLKGILGFVTVLGAGLLDGFNPCAIALLLLFISLLGFTENKRTLILVSLVYIFALFISYFFIGVFLINFLTKYAANIVILRTILNWGILSIAAVLFLLNMHDFLRAKSNEYGKIKNQLPKWIQKNNKRIVQFFTNTIDNPDKKRHLIVVLALTFILGVTLSITELVCTGQIYFGVLDGISQTGDIYALILLISYNIMFVLPLIVIAVISIKGRSVMGVSNYIREHLHTIKLFNALLFLGIVIYYLTRIF
ncbi:MAG: hypothetical protein K9L74_06420 [Candidatus Izimaplasma sp.]|nr:hypothetical protein [Candidatus Izimaplasma bacterium]